MDMSNAQKNEASGSRSNGDGPRSSDQTDKRYQNLSDEQVPCSSNAPYENCVDLCREQEKQREDDIWRGTVCKSDQFKAREYQAYIKFKEDQKKMFSYYCEARYAAGDDVEAVSELNKAQSRDRNALSSNLSKFVNELLAEEKKKEKKDDWNRPTFFGLRNEREIEVQRKFYEEEELRNAIYDEALILAGNDDEEKKKLNEDRSRDYLDSQQKFRETLSELRVAEYDQAQKEARELLARSGQKYLDDQGRILEFPVFGQDSNAEMEWRIRNGIKLVLSNNLRPTVEEREARRWSECTELYVLSVEDAVRKWKRLGREAIKEKCDIFHDCVDDFVNHLVRNNKYGKILDEGSDGTLSDTSLIENIEIYCCCDEVPPGQENKTSNIRVKEFLEQRKDHEEEQNILIDIFEDVFKNLLNSNQDVSENQENCEKRSIDSWEVHRTELKCLDTNIIIKNYLDEKNNEYVNRWLNENSSYFPEQDDDNERWYDCREKLGDSTRGSMSDVSVLSELEEN